MNLMIDDSNRSNIKLPSLLFQQVASRRLRIIREIFVPVLNVDLKMFASLIHNASFHFIAEIV